tara:strand:- start:238 stop:444 length:207 start_codon:yes stop_codon:yes gene_type:complete
MQLDHKKNIRASVYIDDQKIIDLENSRVYSKIDPHTDEVYFLIKNEQTGRTAKLLIKKYAEEEVVKDI